MRDYYIFKNGRMRRKDNSVFLETKEGDISIPVRNVDSLCLFGEIDLNTRIINLLGKNGIVAHVFNYYGGYTGSFYPKENLLAGDIIIKQVEHYLDAKKRMEIAREFVKGAIHGFILNVKRYPEVKAYILEKLQYLYQECEKQLSVSALMGVEGNARDLYYSVFPDIIKQKIEFEKRVKHPPDNMMNAMISFVNSLVYAVVTKEIYKTQLNPTISYLHEPFYRRFSLSLDVAEIFKPIYGDRIIFDLLNNREITEKNFETNAEGCYLKEDGLKKVVKAFDERMQTTIIHKGLKRKISYQHIIRLELHKLAKHFLNQKKYEHFRMWW